VELAIFPRDQLGEGLVFKDAIRFEVAYPEPDDLPDVRTHARINIFVDCWLDMLAAEGYKF
jgi:uncharacterized protein YqiB (DUF1249 family)